MTFEERQRKAFGEIAAQRQQEWPDLGKFMQAAAERAYGTGGYTHTPRNPHAAQSCWQEEESMHERLKNLDKNAQSGTDLEGLVELAAYGRQLLVEYKANKIPAPKWLETNLRLLGSQIKAAHRATQEAELRRLEKDIEDLKSKEEKRAAKEAEAKKLREELGIEEG